jgi:hypothetical protein
VDPARALAAGFCDRLLWCDANREELASMVRASADLFQSRDWSQVAEEFADQVRELRSRQPAQPHLPDGRTTDY